MAPLLWRAPRANVAEPATSTRARAPRAVALLEYSVPAATLTWAPSTRLAAAAVRVRAPAPPLVRVEAVPPSFRAPRVSVPAPVPLLATLIVAVPVRLVAPRFRVYAWLFGVPGSAATFSVAPAPRVRAPIVTVFTVGELGAR